jgi:hypothetical protein
MSCAVQRQGDEMFCATCDRRWPADDPVQVCERAVQEPKIDRLALMVRLAQAINGPHDERWVGREKLLEIRRHKWNKQMKAQERRAAFVSVESVLKELRQLSRENVLALIYPKE